MEEYVIPSTEKFNMGMGYYARCNRLLDYATLARMQGDKHNWYMCLWSLYIEVECKCNAEKERVELHLKYNNILEQMRGKATNIPDSLLTDFEMFLRRLMEKKNMLSPKGEDPGRAIMSGGI